MGWKLNRKTLTDIGIIIVAVLALTLPFINQAIHLDDEEFITFARLQQDEPLQFYMEDHEHNGLYYEKFRTSHPPFMSSYYAMVIWLSGGESEAVLHGAFLLFPLAAALSMYWLSRRYCRYPLAATLALVVSSGFVVMSHNLRGDLPGLAFWTASVAAYVWGTDRSSRKLLGLSSLLMALTVLIEYQGLSLIPLLFLYAWTRKQLGLKTILPLLVPVVVFGALAVFLSRTAGGGPQMVYNVGLDFGWQDPELKLRALIVFIGGSIIFPLAFIPVFIRRAAEAQYFVLLAFVVSVVAIAAPLRTGTIDFTQALILFIMLVAGLAIFFQAAQWVVNGASDLFRRGIKCDDDLFLAVWLIGVALYVLLFLPYVSVRYLLPLFPPVIILFMRGLEGLMPARRQVARFLGPALALMLAYSLVAAVADYRLADSFRDMARRLSVEYAGRQAEVWFLGEFGFRYYMEKEGFRYMSINSTAEPGDIVIRSEQAAGIEPNVIIPPPPARYSIIIRQVDVEDDFPFRLRNPLAGAGFYTHRGGPVPLIPSRERLDQYTYYQLDW